MSHFVTARAAGSRAKLALLMVAGGLGCAMSAGAANADTDARSMVVRYSTEALSTHIGVEDLYRRIRYAAKRVCPESSVHDLRANELAEVCRQQAVTRAIQKINNSQLAALHATNSKNG